MLLRALWVLLGLWGLLLSLGLFAGRLGWSAETTDPADAAGACAPGDATPTADDPAAAHPAEPGHEDGPAPTVATRHALCEDAVGLPHIDLHDLDGTPLLSVHCGQRIRWLGVSHAGGEVSLRVEAEQTLSARGASHRPTSVAPRLLHGDGAATASTTFAIGARYLDAQQRPVEGGLWTLHPLAGGGLSAPTRLAGALPLQLLTGRFEGSLETLGWLDAGGDGQAHRLVVLGPGPTPSPLFEQAVGDASAAATLDLDGDGDSDVVLAGAEGSAQWWLSGDGAELGQAALGPLRDVLAGDLDGDGTPDALWAGEGLWVTRAAQAGRPGEPSQLPAPTPTPIEGAHCQLPDCPRDLQLRDVDGDGRLDIVHYLHPQLSYRRNRGGLTFDPPRSLARLQGESMAVVQTLTMPAADGGLTLLVLGHAADAPGQVELAVVSDLQRAPRIALGGDAQPMEEAPLRSRHVVR